VSLQKKLAQRTRRRIFRVRNRFMSKGEKLRISVFRSLKHIYVQVIDDKGQKTLLTGSSMSLKDLSGDKKDIAKRVGLDAGKKLVEQGVKDVFFDRGKYLYHGRVRALADVLREGGLNF